MKLLDALHTFALLVALAVLIYLAYGASFFDNLSSIFHR